MGKQNISLNISIVSLWKLCLEREIPNQPQGWLQVIKNLVKSKKSSKISGWNNVTVHDAACGTGKVMEYLYHHEVQVSGSDASHTMLMEEIHANKIAIENGEKPSKRPKINQKLWTELPKHFAKLERKNGLNAKPKIMIVPGSSIPYAGSWDQNSSTRKSSVREQEIRIALLSFKQSIRPGGVLILTTTPDKSFKKIAKSGKEIDEFESIVKGKKLQIKEVITHKPRKKIRKWKTTIKFPDGHNQTIIRNAFMLPRLELKQMLKDAGFTKVKNIDVSGEKGHYDGVIAEVR